jgi:hypothetical protein
MVPPPFFQSTRYDHSSWGQERLGEDHELVAATAKKGVHYGPDHG